MADTRILPPWAEDLRRRYLRNEAVLFVLHGNVHDLVLVDGALKPLTEFLTDVFWKDVRDTIAVYNLATGVRFPKKAKEAEAQAELMREAPREKALAGIERLLVTSRKVGVVLEYAETIAPSGDPSFQGDLDRASIVTLHRWSFLPQIEKQDNVVLLVAENLAELSPKLVSNPKVAVVDVPMPDRETRRAAARIVDPRLSEKEAERYADLTAGLKLLQIEAILAPPPPAEEDRSEREAFIAGLLGTAPDAAERAKKLSQLTAGLTRDEIRALLAPGAADPAAAAASGPGVEVAAALPPGTGPRHFAELPGGALVAAGELDGRLHVLAPAGPNAWAPATAHPSTVGTYALSQLSHVTLTGDLVVVGVRGADLLATHRLVPAAATAGPAAAPVLAPLADVPLGDGAWPRHHAILGDAQDGHLLAVVARQGTNDLAAVLIDPATGDGSVAGSVSFPTPPMCVLEAS